MDPAAQVLSRDPGDLGSSTSDFARDPMDLGPCFLFFSRDLVDFYRFYNFNDLFLC